MMPTTRLHSWQRQRRLVAHLLERKTRTDFLDAGDGVTGCIETRKYGGVVWSRLANSQGVLGPLAVSTELRCESECDVMLMDVAVRVWPGATIVAHELLDLRLVVAVDDFAQIIEQLHHRQRLLDGPVLVDDQGNALLQTLR